MIKRLLLIIITFPVLSHAQDQHAQVIRSIYDEQLTESPIYENLRYLCKEIGHRISGSPQAAAAVEYTRQLMVDYDFDTVYLQPVIVNNWVRGEVEQVRIVSSNTVGTLDLSCTLLGNSGATVINGFTAEVVSVQSLDELKSLGEKGVEGRIVFFNRPFDQTLIQTGSAYGKAGDQRFQGPALAASLGARAALVRSLSSSTDDAPHTGATRFTDVDPIPAFAISTLAADQLTRVMETEGKAHVYVNAQPQMKGTIETFNVIGEIRGSVYPDKYIAVGGHLDSWDLGEGAHDDGGPCLQTIEVGRTFKKLGIQPRHTLRVVMWMNEENGGAGAYAYADAAREKGEEHVAGLESDSGVFTPLGFNFQTDSEDHWSLINSWKPYFEPYQLFWFKSGGSGADVSKLKTDSNLLIGFKPDSQRYFSLHHTELDVFEAVNKREIELGAAAMTSLIYLVDQTIDQ